DFGALPSSTVAGRKQFHIVALFDDKNPLPGVMKDAVLVNKHFNMNLPPLISGARAWGIQTEAAAKYPDRFKILNDTAKAVFDHPDYRKEGERAKQPWEYIQYGDAEACKKYVASIMDIGREYKSLLTGKA